MATFLQFPKDGGPHSESSVGQALAGLVPRGTDGMPKTGMLTAPTVAAVAASWKAEVGRFVHVHHNAGAIQLSGLSGSEQVDIDTAAGIPAGQSRIDRVCWDPVGSELVVVQGTAAVSPVAPSVGAMAPVARVQVKSGDGMVLAGQVSADFVVAAENEPVTRTVAIPLSGATGSAAGAYWRDFSVSFPSPYTEAPHLQATGIFPPESVQFLEIKSVSASGFLGRVIRLGHSTVLAGQVTYTVTEK